MSKYIEITVNSEYNRSVSDIVNKLHVLFVKMGHYTFSIDLPKCDKEIGTLGSVVRVFAEGELLNKLANDYGDEFSEYSVSSVKNTPEEHTRVCLKRVQSSKSSAKLRRLLRRGNTDVSKFAYASSQVKDSLDALYINMYSRSSKQNYKRFFDIVDEKESLPKPDSFGFGCAVPRF